MNTDESRNSATEDQKVMNENPEYASILNEFNDK